MKNNKTPGEDGIPVDFYKVFWNQLKKPFMQMMHEVYEKGKLHCTARQGILNLIPKAGKDARVVKNLRPITLLNTDYKIIEKGVAEKMIPSLNQIIHRDQRGFMKNRRISVNIRKLLDIMHMADVQDMEAVVLSMDFVKCFDRCSFRILFGSLDYFGFGEMVKTWTEILYKDFMVKIQNNGHFSSHIDIERGVHQGGCCSAIYFLVIAEILAISLRGNEEIEGIVVKEIISLLNQFADDMDIFSMASEKSIRAIMGELHSFQLQSGFLVSYDKTTLYRIGSLRYSKAAMYNITDFAWSSADIKVLGVTISYDEISDKNFEPMISKVRTILGSWENRGLSLLGKVQVINSLIASQFVYKMMVLPNISSRIIKCLENEIRDYLWNGKKSKVAFRTLQNDKQNGGLKLVNLKYKEKALKATWPQILKTEPEYSQIVYNILRCSTLGEDLWRCNLKMEDVQYLRIKEEFWHQVLESWCLYNFNNNVRVENQLLWYNSLIRVRGKPIFWQDMYKNGLKYVHQLFEGGDFRSQECMWEDFRLSPLRYNSLKVSIPLCWKQFFQEYGHQILFSPIPPHNYDQSITVKLKNFAREVYWTIMDDILVIHNKYLKWRQELGEEWGEEANLIDYGKYHKRLYAITNVPKFRSFQYRVLQRALVTNVQMKHWGMIESDLCSFCGECRESISHLLASCSMVLSLWGRVKGWLEVKYEGISMEWGIKNIIFNTVARTDRHVINFLVLVTKQYIYRQRCMKSNLSFAELIRIFEKYSRIEKYIAIKHGKLPMYVKKWENLKKDSTYNVRVDISEFISEYVLEM